ncbi:MAG: response regulator [Gemmatimonadetes bacterium]|nr:response regulator [Gemmatimonadota bacterium]
MTYPRELLTIALLAPATAEGALHLWATGVALVLSVAAIVTASAALLRRRRIRELAAASRRIAAGELDGVVRVGGSDDVAELGVELERIRAALLAREREVGDLTAQVERLKGRTEGAERASDAKTRFIGNVSHEFRTPLSSIIGFTSLLSAEHSRLPDARRAEYLEIVLRNARHLLHVINDILNLSKVEAGTLEVTPSPVYVPEAVAAVVASLGPMADERAIRIHALDHSRHFAIADTGRLRQVLQNLLENAIKYSPQGTEVEVEVGSGPGGVRVDVRDRGPGISPADRPRLFKEFSRINLPGVRVAGAGLGLALSKQLVELMGGSIGVEARPEGGSVFWVTLPAGEAIASGTAAAQCPAGAADPVRRGAVAVVDDDPDIRAFVAAILGGVGYQVVSDDGREGASDRLCDRVPDVVLLDLHLEGRGGFEALDELRACEALHGVPVIAFTASGAPDDLARIRAARFDGHLIKPVEPDTLVRCIDGTLAAASAARAGTRPAPGAESLPAATAHPFIPASGANVPTDAASAPPDTRAADGGGERVDGAGEGGGDDALDDAEDYLAPLRARFRAGLPARLAEMERAIAMGDMELLQREAHKLKGAAAGYGLARLSEIAAAAEDALRAGGGAAAPQAGTMLGFLADVTEGRRAG